MAARRTLLLLALLAGAHLPGAALAQSAASQGAAAQGTSAQGAKGPAEPAAGGFSVPVALFVQEPATGYGMYKVRASQAFKEGEPLFFYLEPAGFGYAKDGDLNRFGAVVDLRITENGKTVFAKDAFLDAKFTSHHQNREINFSGRLDVNGAPKGDYKLELVVRDAVSTKTSLVELPFSIQ